MTTSPRVGELDRIADEVEQDLRQATLVAVARSESPAATSVLERELLVGGQRLDGAMNCLDNGLQASNRPGRV